MIKVLLNTEVVGSAVAVVSLETQRRKACRTVHLRYRIVVHLKLGKTTRADEESRSFILCCKDCLILLIYSR
jgi:hypothetical protein